MRLICPLVALLALNASCASTSKPTVGAVSSELNKAEDCKQEVTVGSRLARKSCVTKKPAAEAQPSNPAQAAN